MTKTDRKQRTTKSKAITNYQEGNKVMQRTKRLHTRKTEKVHSCRRDINLRDTCKSQHCMAI